QVEASDAGRRRENGEHGEQRPWRNGERGLRRDEEQKEMPDEADECAAAEQPACLVVARDCLTMRCPDAATDGQQGVAADNREGRDERDADRRGEPPDRENHPREQGAGDRENWSARRAGLGEET